MTKKTETIKGSKHFLLRKKEDQKIQNNRNLELWQGLEQENKDIY